MNSVYQINKGINRPIVFRGLMGQYIGWLAAGLVSLLVGFAVLYVLGVPVYLLLPGVLGLGTALFVLVGRLSKRFGAHGLEKYFAARGLPVALRFRSRRLFTGLKYGSGLSGRKR
ncbi:DUF4133 domain-containing protein [Pedobacter deserti]|uniref:DUF4133 domain-containing protein n=1 Tax=Pedobacter deserti TaxID=2817382 RepID=UPI002108D502|nr:DUF4133 domain-containing protein [Pedobacter sp. SYSU D00382]